MQNRDFSSAVTRYYSGFLAFLGDISFLWLPLVLRLVVETNKKAPFPSTNDVFAALTGLALAVIVRLVKIEFALNKTDSRFVFGWPDELVKKLLKAARPSDEILIATTWLGRKETYLPLLKEAIGRGVKVRIILTNEQHAKQREAEVGPDYIVTGHWPENLALSQDPSIGQKVRLLNAIPHLETVIIGGTTVCNWLPIGMQGWDERNAIMVYETTSELGILVKDNFERMWSMSVPAALPSGSTVTFPTATAQNALTPGP